MAGFADSEFPLAQPFGWFDQLSAWLVRKLACAELAKTPHCASHGHDCHDRRRAGRELSGQRSRNLRNKWRSMFGNTVDRSEQFVHSGNDGDLGTFAGAAEA